MTADLVQENGGRPEVFVVTGAASGIGRHWASVLAARGEGCRLVLVDANEAGLRSAFSETEAVRLHAFDVRTVERWRAMVDDTVHRFGRIDYLFNIAGGGRPGFLLDVPMDLVRTTIDVNLTGQIYGMKTVAPVMVEQGSGHIVNVSSLAGIAPTPGNELYSAAKTGLRAVSLATAIRLRPLGVHVSVVCPDVVDTPTVTRHLALDPKDVALIYSGPPPLAVEVVERAFVRVMTTRQLELAVPSWRGALVRITNLFPFLMLRLYQPLMRKGLARFHRLKLERTGEAPLRLARRTRAVRAVVAFILRRLARLEVHGAEHLPARGPAVLVFNQLSILDTPLMTMLGGSRHVTGLVARDYRSKPLYRALLEWGGVIWLSRQAADHNAFKRGLAALDRGWLLAISPEGRRSPTGALVRGKRGAAFLARRADVPIVPVAITGSERVAGSLRRLRRARVTIRVGEPFRLVDSSGPDRRATLAQDTDRIMERLAALLPSTYRGAYDHASPALGPAHEEVLS